MQDKEFTMAKSLLTALTGRSRSNNDAAAKNKAESSATASKASKSSKSSKAARPARPPRRHRFDDKSGGPPAPRGSLTDEKLSYLDWRLKRINKVRLQSENTDDCWYDGRDTIGRTSFVIERPSTAATSNEEAPLAVISAQAPPAAQVTMPRSMAAILAEEKAAGLKALEHAYAGDCVLAGMPRLSKRDSSSGSELSGSSDQHAVDLPMVLHATNDKDVGVYYSKPRQSLLSRANSRFGRKRSAVVKAESAIEISTAARPASRGNHSLARIWTRRD